MKAPTPAPYGAKRDGQPHRGNRQTVAHVSLKHNGMIHSNHGLRVQGLMYAEQYGVAIHPRADIDVCRSLAQSCVKQSTVVLATIKMHVGMSASLIFDQDRVLFPKIRRPSYLGFPEKSRAWYHMLPTSFLQHHALCLDDFGDGLVSALGRDYLVQRIKKRRNCA